MSKTSRRFEDSPTGKKLLELVNDPKMAAAIGGVLAETIAELADAYAERNHWHTSFSTVMAEMKQLAAIILMKEPHKRLVVTEKELRAIPRELQLVMETPEPGVRIYALHHRAPIPAEVNQILAPGGRA